MTNSSTLLLIYKRLPTPSPGSLIELLIHFAPAIKYEVSDWFILFEVLRVNYNCAARNATHVRFVMVTLAADSTMQFMIDIPVTRIKMFAVEVLVVLCLVNFTLATIFIRNFFFFFFKLSVRKTLEELNSF